MTTLAHGVHGAAIGYALSGFRTDVAAIILIVLYTISGAWPDLVRPVWSNKFANWELYNYIHKPWLYNLPVKILACSLWALVPPIGVHCIIDYFGHNKKTGKWNWFSYVMEVVTWISLIIFLYINW